MKSFFEKFTAAVPAGGAPITINKAGEFILIRESDFPIELNIPGVTNGWEVCEVGIEYRMSEGESFTAFKLRTAAADAATTIQGSVGAGRITDNRLNYVSTRPNQVLRLVDAPSTTMEVVQTVGSPLASMGATGLINGAATAARGRRRYAIINNLDPTGPLWLVKGATYPADYLMYVPPLDSRRFDGDAPFYIHNPNGTTLQMVCTSVFWDAPKA